MKLKKNFNVLLFGTVDTIDNLGRERVILLQTRAVCTFSQNTHPIGTAGPSLFFLIKVTFKDF